MYAATVFKHDHFVNEYFLDRRVNRDSKFHTQRVVRELSLLIVLYTIQLQSLIDLDRIQRFQTIPIFLQTTLLLHLNSGVFSDGGRESRVHRAVESETEEVIITHTRLEAFKVYDK